MDASKSAVSVRELIEKYNRELLELKDKHTPAAVPAMQNLQEELDIQYPEPNIETDLMNLRDSSQQTTPEQAEENAVNKELSGQNDTPPELVSNTQPTTPLAEPELLPPSNPPPFEMSSGYLRAFVTTGRGTLPLPNAQVVVTRIIDDSEALEQAVRTDISGYTPLFTLPAVGGQYSQSPDNAKPYTLYNMYVRAEGFYPVLLRNIPMYGGITAIQPVDMIPVTEGDDPNTELIVDEGAPENLQ